MPTLTRSCDQQLLRATVLPAPSTTAEALSAGRPPGLEGSNMTNLGSNCGLTREKWSLQVDAPVMLCRRDHLLVFAFVLPTPATNAGALPTGPPPDPESSNVTDLTSNHGPTRENEPLQVDAPAQRGRRLKSADGGGGVGYFRNCGRVLVDEKSESEVVTMCCWFVSRPNGSPPSELGELVAPNSHSVLTIPKLVVVVWLRRLEF
ncbi:delta tubulin [Dorcoceras hygrometricum]|uniref:Delta tubulin n=1 Tax=Dorcoceras hygrometricum TaxID=472368 RepID=A0A2Z7D447_9LAMI|nr:delta tubulin [Dorcoceras hygrometricum]